MPREIKFKAKRIDTGEWAFGNLLMSEPLVSGKVEECFICVPFANASMVAQHAVFHETICQYTGRNDAEIDGQEVWESDLIQNCDTKEIQVVYWDKKECAWYCMYLNDTTRQVSLADSLGNLNKKIGNIHDQKGDDNG